MSLKHRLKKLYEDRENNNLVIFIGAGISKYYSTANFPDWNDLTKALSFGQNNDNALQVAQIYQDNSSKYELFKKVKSLFPTEYKPKSDIHDLILKLNPVHILTTNYDNLIEIAMDEYGNLQNYHIVDKDKDLPLTNEKQKLLVKVHGSFDSQNIILSEEDYSEYEKNYPLILSFIRYIFSRHRVLFLGFSLTDPNFNRILYNVKNILKDESLEHTVVLHNGISEEEKEYFKAKKVYPITQSEIINEFSEYKLNDKNYLKSFLEEIKTLNYYKLYKYSENDFLNEFLEITNKFDVLKYYLPTTLNKMFESSNLKQYSSNIQIISNNINYKFSYLGKITSISETFEKIFESKELNQEFKEKYFDKFLELMLKSNILYLGKFQHKYKNNNHGNNIDINNNKNLNYLLTYSINEKFHFKDSVFINDSNYFNDLTLNSNHFFTKYLLGKRRESFEIFKNINVDKINLYKYYIHSFKLAYISSNLILTKGDVFEDFINYINIFKEIFNNFRQNEQNFFKELHNLEFAKEFKNYLLELQMNKDKFIDNKNTKLSQNNILPINEQISFYVNYSSFLKFIYLNEFPIFDIDEIKYIIKEANKLIFKFFIQNFEYSNNFEIPNWFIFSIALGETEDIRNLVVEFHNKNYYKNKKLSFDKIYIENLFKNIESKISEKAIFKIENILLLLSSFVKDEEEFLFVFEYYSKVIKLQKDNLKEDDREFRKKNKDIEQELSNINDIIYLAYLNLQKQSKLTNKSFEKIKIFLDEVLEIVLSSDSFIFDNELFNFLYDLLEDYEYIVTKRKVNNDILNKLSNCKFMYKNSMGIILSLYILGYKKDDLNLFFEKLKDIFSKDDFYTLDVQKFDYISKTENSILKIYEYYQVDLGLDKIQNHKLNEFNVSSINYLIQKNLADENYIKKILESKEKIIKKLKNANNHYKLHSFSIIDYRGKIHKIIEFLILTNNLKVLNELNLEEKEFLSNNYTIKNIFSDKYLVFNYQENLLEFLKITESKDILIQSLIWIFDGNKKDKIDNKKFYRLIQNQIEMYSEVK